MKKYLIILVAMGLVVGPTLAEEKPVSLSLGGVYKQFVALGLNKVEGKNKTSVWQNSEVHFKFSGEFANGIKLGGRIELEAQTDGNRIDQAYVDLEGGFGKLRIGSIDSGRYDMTISAPNAGPMGSAGGSYSKYMSKVIGDGVNNAVNYDFSGDAQKLTYFTPRFSGFQGAFSYAPNGNEGKDGAKSLLTAKATSYSNAWDVGLSYKGSFDAVEISAMAGVGGAKAPSEAKGAGFKDFRMYNLGFQLSSHGFTVGAAYAVVDKGVYSKKVTDRVDKISGEGGGDALAVGAVVASEVEALKITDILSNKGHGFTVGAKYADGPWAVSVNMTKGRSEGLISKQTGTAGAVVTSKGKKDKVTAYAVGASYQLGPGVSLKLGYNHTTEKNEANVKTTGSAVTGGIVLGF